MNFLKLLKKPKDIKPLPAYPAIKLEDIPKASALVFYGSPGNRATELFGERLYGFPYHPAPFHASIYISDGDTLNVGMFRTLKTVAEEQKNTRRIDVIVYPHLTDEQREVIAKHALHDTSNPKFGVVLPDYAMTDFLRFGFKWFKPSKKDFCSENVVENFNVGGFNPTDHEPYDTAPWDLVTWAESHPDDAKIYTLYEGDIFKERLGRK